MKNSITNNASQENSTRESSNYPNAAKLLESLRHLDYKNVDALCDIVDNSIDANSSQVWISILANAKNEIDKIEIIDDGFGMDWNTLDQALKLGSETGKNPSFDLGCYGMGLITGSISIGRRLEIVTKSKNSQFIKGIQDLDNIAEKNDFVKEMYELNESEAKECSDKIIALEKKFLIEEDRNIQTEEVSSSTMVTISKLDKCEWNRANAFADSLSRKIGQVFRKFIKAKKCHFYVNGNEVAAIDPIEDVECAVLYEDKVSMENGDITIKICEAKDKGATINEGSGLSQKNQGFYILRNNREIAKGETLGIFTKHNNLNLLRMELSYPATLDPDLNTSFSKKGIRFNQSIQDKVNKVCMPFIRQISKNSVKRQRDNREKKEDFSDVEKFITQRAHLLKTPEVEIEERSPRTKKDEKRKKPEEIHNPRLDITKRKRVDIDSLRVKFVTKSMGEMAPLYDSDQERDMVVVSWNVDHPFYQEIIAPNSDNPDIFNPLAILIYCHANAELISKVNSDSQKIISNIRWDVGRNLAVLFQ